jgi:hypothetical protein
MTRLLLNELRLWFAGRQLWWLQNVRCKHPPERCVTERRPYKLSPMIGGGEIITLQRVCRECGKPDV